MALKNERFSERARIAVSLAEESARQHKHHYVGTEHLLLGLVQQPEGTAGRVLTNLKIDLTKISTAIHFIMGEGKVPPEGAIGVTPRAKKVVDLAAHEAHQMSNSQIGTEHLLIGLLREGEGVAAGVLESLGVKVDGVKAESIRILTSSAMPTPHIPNLNRHGGRPEPVAETPSNHERAANQSPGSQTVFMVHGHDEINVLKLNNMLRDRWHLNPIILRFEPGKGRTLIEKFEEEAEKAANAIVLMTPDDQIELPDSTYAQARPNVIFELGWFFGRLGRKKVCILFKKGTSIHSDLDGINRVEFVDSVEDKFLAIEDELKAAGVL